MLPPFCSSLLRDLLNSYLTCKVCGSKLQTCAPFDDAKGFCLKLKGFCGVCQTDAHLFSTSKRCKKEELFQESLRQTPYELNFRMVAYAREIGLGLSTLQAFFKCLNIGTLPPKN